MNPYEVLKVRSNASEAEIKAAYRRAVKKHHPDVSTADDGEAIVLINQAYELLSDLERRRAFDLGLDSTVQEFVEEDPREVYKREYIRKKLEAVQARLATQKFLFSKLYSINILIAILALILVVDEFLPSLVRKEFGVSEWIVKRRVNRSTYYIRYFQTESFTFAVPHHTNFDYDFKRPERIEIKYTPLFKIPTEVQLRQDTKVVVFEPSRTLYAFALPFHYLLLFSCAVTLAMKKYSPFSFSVSFAPLLLLLLILVFFNYR